MSTYQRWIDSGWGNTSIEGDEKMWNRRASKGPLLFHECFWWVFSQLFKNNFSESPRGVDRWEEGPSSLLIRPGIEPSTSWLWYPLVFWSGGTAGKSWSVSFSARLRSDCRFPPSWSFFKHHFHHFMVMLLDSSPAHGSTDTPGKLPLIQMACLRPSAKICARILHRTWSELYRQDGD